MRTEDQQQESISKQQYTSIRSREQEQDVAYGKEQAQEASYASEGSQYDKQQQEEDY